MVSSFMEKTPCSICQNTKIRYQCEHCHSDICKNCVYFLNDDSFYYLTAKEKIFDLKMFCLGCFKEHIEVKLAQYEELVSKAKEIMIFTKIQSRETRFIKRTDELYQIKDCPDRNEAIMRMAVMAATAGFNAVIDIIIESKKVKLDTSYQTHTWNATGIPVHLDESKLVRDRSFWSTPN